jgi:hypothetical protein
MTNNLQNIKELSISQIARIIAQDWKTVYFAAQPYLSAMLRINNINDQMGYDSGVSVVNYFLSNASKYGKKSAVDSTGETAKAVKNELNRRVKEYYKKK